MDLKELGWKEFFQQQIEEQEQPLLPARVRRQDINCYHLFSAEGDLTGTLPGRLIAQASSKADLPTGGDNEIRLRTVSKPEPHLAILLDKLGLPLPNKPKSI